MFLLLQLLSGDYYSDPELVINPNHETKSLIQLHLSISRSNQNTKQRINQYREKEDWETYPKRNLEAKGAVAAAETTTEAGERDEDEWWIRCVLWDFLSRSKTIAIPAITYKDKRISLDDVFQSEEEEEESVNLRLLCD